MVSFLQDFDAPEFADTVSALHEDSPFRALIAYSLEGQLPPCLDSQRLIFNDEPIPEGARIVHSGYCGARVAVIVEMPAKAVRWTSTSTR